MQPSAHSGKDGTDTRDCKSQVGYNKDGMFFQVHSGPIVSKYDVGCPGYAYRDRQVGIRDVFDGTSQTLAFTETATGNPGSYRGLDWAWSGSGTGTANGINANWNSDPPLTGWGWKTTAFSRSRQSPPGRLQFPDGGRVGAFLVGKYRTVHPTITDDTSGR